LEVEGGGQATQGVTPQRVVGPGAALLTLQQPGLDELLEVVADGWLAEPEGAVSSHTQTGSGLVASRLTILTRWGSAKARNSPAVAVACSSDRAGVASDAQQSGGAITAGVG